MKKSAYIFCGLILLLLTFAAPDAAAQLRRNRRSGTVYGARVEKERVTPVQPDSAALALRDSLRHLDSLRRADSVALLSKSSLEFPAFSNAQDSIISDFSNGRRLIYYYGATSVKYQDVELTANYMEYDMNTGTVFARGVYDSLAGEWIGRPVMTQGAQTYNMEEVRYNFDSRKARIRNMTTTEDDGILHGRDIKMMDDHSINMSHGQYTVCDADHPHYYIDMSVGKVIGQTHTTVFGPAHLVIEDVHLPFVGIPFGFIPKRPQRATGLLMPTFGEEEARGFYMRDLGMYFVFGDHIDLSLTGSYYTLGSWAVDVNSRYRVNYKFNGNLAFNFSHDQTGEKGTRDFYQTRNFGLRWSHSQDSKAHPGTTFSASVNFQSPSNSRYNARSINEAIQNQISSSVSYSHNWNGRFNLSINALHSQNSRDSSYTFTLPNITFSMSTIYPFKQKNRVGKERFYEKISIGYNTSLQNKINFKASEFALNSTMLDRFQNGMAHNFSIGLPNFQVLKYISVAPSVSYSQNWFFRKTEYVYNPETDKVEAQQGPQFGTLGITQNYSAGASVSTRLYGMFNFGKHHKIQAIRHVISPSMSLSWSPDKATYANGYRTLYYKDAAGVDKTYDYNIYAGQMYSPPGRGQSATASLSIGNNLEAKVRDYADTTGTGTKKVKLIDQLTFNTGYNFLADSLKLSTISASMSTTLFGKVTISASAGFDPYAISDRNQRYNRFAITRGQGLARLTNFSASASYSFNGKGHTNGYDGTGSNGRGSSGSTNAYQRIYYHPVTGEYIPEGWLYYTNPDSPWSLNLSGSFTLYRTYTYNKETARLDHANNIMATLNTSGNIRLTPKLSLNMSSGFDFKAMSITTTSISATFDLHCFNISVSWIPTGKWKSYSFRIAANAAALSDLLRFKKSDSYWDN